MNIIRQVIEPDRLVICMGKEKIIQWMNLLAASGKNDLSAYHREEALNTISYYCLTGKYFFTVLF